MNFLKQVQKIDDGRHRFPLVPSPSAERAMQSPYWDKDCEQDADGNLNVRAAAGLYAAAWCLTGGRQQRAKAKAILVEIADEDMAEDLLKAARESVGQPLHGVGALNLIKGLMLGLQAQVKKGSIEAA